MTDSDAFYNMETFTEKTKVKLESLFFHIYIHVGKPVTIRHGIFFYVPTQRTFEQSK